MWRECPWCVLLEREADDDMTSRLQGASDARGEIGGAVPSFRRRYAVDSNALTALARDPGDPVPHRVVGARMGVIVVGAAPWCLDPSPASITPAMGGAS